MKKNVDLEISKLRGEQEELEMNISYFQDFANNLEDLPENTGEFLKELRDQINWLTDLGKQTAESLSALEKLSKQITDAIKNVARLLKGSLNTFDGEYSDYISEALDNVINSEDPTLGLATVKEYLSDYALTNDLVKEISINATKLEDISEQAKEIQSKLDELRNEYKAKKLIVDRFQKIFDEYKKQKAEEDKLYTSDVIVNKVLSTEDKGIPSREYSKEFEADPKKSNEIVPRATVPVEEGKPHQIRANAFGVKLNSLPNRKDIRGVYITSKNQNQLLPGVIERMLDNNPDLIKKYKDSMIVLVMVNTKGELVGLDGQAIAPGTELLDAAIYQAFPENKMRDGSLFRATTPQDVRDAIIVQYDKWRDAVLMQTTVGPKHEIEASFGIIENVKDASGNTVYSTRTSVVSSGLITPSQLERSQLIFIPKTNTRVSKGTVSYDSALGMVFLETPNGYTKLQNRQHTEAEANAIFDAMLLFAKNMINPQEGTDSDSSKRALRFLQGTTYWGIPRNQHGTRKEKDGYSSLFFEKSAETGRLTIMIGGKDVGVLFTPSAMKLNKERLIAEIGKIYTNTNSAFAQDLNEKFEQIISISPEGEIKSEVWDNYQTCYQMLSLMDLKEKIMNFLYLLQQDL
jgi:archaellum component FlaC